jgi:MoaA/NifB/PqqE/SkfB family radical SAM enzyme
MGGLSHLHVDSLGNVQPCVFVPVAFGSVRDESFGAIHARMREAVPRPLHAGCASQLLADEVGFDPARQPRLPVPYESVREPWRRMWQ